MIWQNTNLTQLIYVSAQTSKNSAMDLIDIQEVASKNNKLNSVTGLLLYKEETFMQLIEGPSEEVRSLFKKIETDHRHKNIVKIIEEPIAKRSFQNWSMAVRELPKNIQLPHGIADFSDPNLIEAGNDSRGLIAVDILNGFKNDLAYA